jgi:hypothetical protein
MPSTQKPPSIAVVHLIWLPLGIDRFTMFIQSYIAHPTKTAHQLVLLFNGVKNTAAIQPYLNLVASHNIPCIHFVKEGGQDLAAYHWVCTQLEHELVLFLNSYSAFNNDHWLEKYMGHFVGSVGMIAATGSYQSLYSTVFAENTWRPEPAKGWHQQWGKYKLLLKNLFFWRFHFKPFPAPHLRTNAFMMQREVFLRVKVPVLKTKRQAYRFESGRRSLTNQVLQMGLAVKIVDRQGRSYAIPDWPQANVFWQGNQENLLVSDNQTAAYAQATEAEKRTMTKLAWGIT